MVKNWSNITNFIWLILYDLYSIKFNPKLLFVGMTSAMIKIWNPRKYTGGAGKSEQEMGKVPGERPLCIAVVAVNGISQRSRSTHRSIT